MEARGPVSAKTAIQGPRARGVASEQRACAASLSLCLAELLSAAGARCSALARADVLRAADMCKRVRNVRHTLPCQGRRSPWRCRRCGVAPEASRGQREGARGQEKEAQMTAIHRAFLAGLPVDANSAG